MTLEEWRESQGLSYENLARMLDMTTNKVFRLCKGSACFKVPDAMRIKNITRDEVDFADMMPDEC